MNIIVPVKQVPDLVEELEIGPDGTDLDREYLKYVMNEFDEHALEAALLLKEATGGSVTVMTLDMGEADQLLFTAAAKGADTLVKITGDFDGRPPDSHALAQIFAAAIQGRPFDLIVTGVQAADDLDGQVGPLLGTALGVLHVSVVSGLEPSGAGVTVHQEFGGGMMVELELPTPCVLGIQAAKQAPRYAPITRVRQAMQSAQIEEVAAAAGEPSALTIRKMVKPQSGSRAEMLTGSPEDIAERVAGILRERGLVKA